MIRHVWSVLCRQVYVDPETDEVALTLLDLLPAVTDEPAPMMVGTQFDLVTLWYCDIESAAFSYIVKATGPSGRALAETEVPAAQFVPPVHRMRTRLRFAGVAYDGPGVYWFRVMRLVDGQEILDAEVPLAIP